MLVLILKLKKYNVESSLYFFSGGLMKRRYKLLLIILIGAIFTILINSTSIENKISLVAIGDGVSLGMTAYQMVGYSYNDYLGEYYAGKNMLQSYNNEFSIEHLTMEELYDILEENKVGQKSKVPIKQTLAKADVITINIGMDEFIDLTIKKRLNEDKLEEYLLCYSKILENIRVFYDKEIIVVGLYPIYDLEKNTVYDINQKIQSITSANKAKFLDIMALSLNPEYYVDETSYYMNYKGHKAIYNQLLKLL